MAKQKRTPNGVNKSASIRDILTNAPHTPVKEIVATLGQQGITVHPNLVYLIKSKMKQRKRRQKRQQAVAMSGANGIVNPIELILKVKKLAGDAGGIRNLKKLVDVLAE